MTKKSNMYYCFHFYLKGLAYAAYCLVQVTKEQELKLDKNRKKFDIREEYFVRQSNIHTLFGSILSETLQKLSAQAEEEWEPRRIPRPMGVPEWGVPPTEPPPKSSEPPSKSS